MNNTLLKCSWKNFGIGAAIAGVASLGIRWLVWWFMFHEAPVDVVTDEFCFDFEAVLLPAVVLLLGFWALCYKHYIKKARKSPTDLRSVKKSGDWVGYLLGLLAFLTLWTAVFLFFVLKKSFGLDFSLETDRPLRRLGLIAFGITSLVDVLLFVLCALCFETSPVQDA